MRPPPLFLAAAVIVSIFLLFLFSSSYQQIYQPKYTLQQSYLKYNRQSTNYNIAVIADLDVNSKTEDKKWRSVLMKGNLTRNSTGMYSVEWSEEENIYGELNENGRGMELSDLVYFNNQLLSCDDRSGIVFEIVGTDAYPRFILPQGDGKDVKGLKCEWMTVKDDQLYIGSIGKEWTTKKGEFIHNKLMWVKVLDLNGNIRSFDWSSQYAKVKEALGVKDPGYVIHEAVSWDANTRRWLFLPRRISIEDAYDVVTEELKGSNLAVFFDENFTYHSIQMYGDFVPTRGFSSFKFIPHRPEEIVALKSVEYDGLIETYITVFNVNSGKVLMSETKIGTIKYEGIEIV